ncbi:MAG: hypothetical protein JWL60_971 [Gemmatimonadetes bacterium]|jgi:tetratricopeptide (TPR) repeat protein|nr:hypothetical protein [Gemmatimonadota bacterium]
MRLARRTLLIVLSGAAFLAPAPSASAQRLTARQWAESVRRSIDAATRAGGVPRLQASRALVSRALAAYPDDPLLRHYQGFLLYRLITVAGPTLPPAATAAYLDEARVALEASIARRPLAESYLLLSEIYSRQIAADPSRAANLGRAMALARARAISVGATNPRVYLLAGIAAIYADRAAGGGLDAAEQLLRAALELFERDRARPPEPAWGRAEAYAWLGQVYERTARRPAARELYAQALALEPDNAWVRDVLLPSVQ